MKLRNNLLIIISILCLQINFSSELKDPVNNQKQNKNSKIMFPLGGATGLGLVSFMLLRENRSLLKKILGTSGGIITGGLLGKIIQEKFFSSEKEDNKKLIEPKIDPKSPEKLENQEPENNKVYVLYNELFINEDKEIMDAIPQEEYKKIIDEPDPLVMNNFDLNTEKHAQPLCTIFSQSIAIKENFFILDKKWLTAEDKDNTYEQKLYNLIDELLFFQDKETIKEIIRSLCNLKNSLGKELSSKAGYIAKKLAQYLNTVYEKLQEKIKNIKEIKKQTIESEEKKRKKDEHLALLEQKIKQEKYIDTVTNEELCTDFIRYIELTYDAELTELKNIYDQKNEDNWLYFKKYLKFIKIIDKLSTQTKNDVILKTLNSNPSKKVYLTTCLKKYYNKNYLINERITIHYPNKDNHNLDTEYSKGYGTHFLINFFLQETTEIKRDK